MCDFLQNAVEPPPRYFGSWIGVYMINTIIVGWVLVVGFGFGGWASMTNFIHQINTFGLFTKCYQCLPPLPPIPVPVNTPGIAPSPLSYNYIPNSTQSIFSSPSPSPSYLRHHFLLHHYHHGH